MTNLTQRLLASNVASQAVVSSTWNMHDTGREVKRVEPLEVGANQAVKL